MDEFESILCLCPAKRLPAASLVLSTWTGVRRFVLTEDEGHLTGLDEFSAVMVMDRFVNEPLVRRVAARRPVVVLAWNGLFEIDRYRRALGDLDVIYMGTEASIPREMPIRYIPMINGGCSFTRWSDLYRHKQQFVARGNARYVARWLRTRLLPLRAANLVISAAGALRRPRVLAKTLASGFVRDKLIWAGECILDYASIGLSESERETIEPKVKAASAEATPARRLRASLDLIRGWQAHATSILGPGRGHQALFITNTLLRWAVLSFLGSTANASTWFFGKDNLDLGLELTLYLHNLVPNERVAYLELGGTKTSGTALYPRSLHLLAREFYVISIPAPEAGEKVIEALDRIRLALAEHPHDFFEGLERRRRVLYAGVCAGDRLEGVQGRVWADFSGMKERAS